VKRHLVRKEHIYVIKSYDSWAIFLKMMSEISKKYFWFIAREDNFTFMSISIFQYEQQT